MATFSPMIITSAGQNALAQAQAGETLTFTRFQVGSGKLATTLTTALTSGTVYTSLAVAALPRAIKLGDTLTIGVGSAQQNVTTSAAANANATSISVTSFTANAAYATGTIVTDITDAQSLTALITPIDYFPINTETVSGTTSNITGVFQNTSLTTSTYTAEIGLYASTTTTGEVLYAYANAGTLGDTFPPYSSGPFSRQFQVSTSVANVTNVTASVPSTVYVATSSVGVTVASLDSGGQVPASQLGNAPAPADATTSKVGLVEVSDAPSGTHPIAVTTDNAAYKNLSGGKYVSSFNTRQGAVTLTSTDVTTALKFTPLSTSGTAADSVKLNGQPGSYYLAATAQAADSAKLGGNLPSHFLAATAQAADSAKLNGQAASYYAAASSVPLSGSQTFTSSGTFTVPANITRVFVECFGGGGGGGSNWGTWGAGGGGGGYAAGWVDVTSGSNYSVTVGAGGAGATSTATAPSGGTSSFGSYVSASGGGGGGSQSNYQSSSTPGSGGGPSKGDFGSSGGVGEQGYTTADQGPVGGGGGPTPSTSGNGGGSVSSASDGVAPSGGGSGTSHNGARGEVRIYW